MSSSLMISVAGVRGIVGESLTPPVVSRFTAAFARELGDGPVVVGRDARTSGPMVLAAVTAGLCAADWPRRPRRSSRSSTCARPGA
jgi:phosphomannomutase